MLDATNQKMQRSRGAAEVVMAPALTGLARVVDLFQSGSAKAMLPRTQAGPAEVVFLNTSGGLTGGDVLDYGLCLHANAHVLGTTQTAERCYDGGGGSADVGVTLSVGAGGRLDWLPQETILFDGAALRRRTRIDLTGNASCLMAESVVLGRAAMGETLRRLDVIDHRLVRRDGRPVWADSLALNDKVLADANNPALLGGARAVGVVALIADGAQDAVSAVQALPEQEGCRSAVSGWDGKCLIRLMADDGLPLKRQMARILTLMCGRPLPRVWQTGD